jgi:hypothetical protein
MEQQVQRCVIGAAGAGFVLVWTTLGLKPAILSAVAALAAANYQRLTVLSRGRRRSRSSPRQRPIIRVQRLGDESYDPLPMVPDEPSLIINASGY